MKHSASLVGSTVTLFGGTGFLGRHLVQRLARAGARVRVVSRNTERGMFLKPLGDPGQIVLVAGNVRDEASVAAAVAGADAVVNLVGVLYESGRQSFASMHVESAGRIARAAAAAGVKRLIQVSAIGAAADAPALYARSKAAGEQAVRAAFPGAAVVRPSIVFGPEDSFFNRFAAMATVSPVLPLIGGDIFDERLGGGLLFRGRRLGAGTTRFQPVYVGDVAEAILRIAADPDSAGQTFELGGPHVYDFRELLEIVLRETGRRRLLLPVPFWVATIEAWFLGLLPKPLLTCDQVRLLKRDNLADGGAPGLAELGIAPTAVEAVVPGYLGRFRRRGAADSVATYQ